MQSYSMFIAKKGRPKSQARQSVTSLKKSDDSDVVLSLFYLKKLNQNQYEAAKIYEVLCCRYYASIEAPICSSSSWSDVPRDGCKTRINPSVNDDLLFKHWSAIRSLLKRIYIDCDQILYKVIIEGKMKYELLNPRNLTRNTLEIVQVGLDAVYRYSQMNTYVASLV